MSVVVTLAVMSDADLNAIMDRSSLFQGEAGEAAKKKGAKKKGANGNGNGKASAQGGKKGRATDAKASSAFKIIEDEGQGGFLDALTV